MLKGQSGFSLVELAVVIAIMGTVAVMGLEMASRIMLSRSYTDTQDKLALIDQRLLKYYHVYGRLPCPAGLNLPPTSPLYGQEQCAAFMLGGAQVGAIPTQSLNLPPEAAIDAYGSKINYRVAVLMDDPTTFDHAASMKVRTGKLEDPCTTSCSVLTTEAVYIIFSSGADKRGGYSRFGIRKPCIEPGDVRIDSQNCSAMDGNQSGMAITPPMDTVYDSRYNNGTELSNYYDDQIIWRTKARLYE